jgi:16S rRNA (adenine(1408)-N(1))-methyltransferase
METIRGRKSQFLDLDGFRERLKIYPRVILDLGTGDGHYVHFLAERYPSCFIIGVDACRENVRECSRRQLPNALFVIANAQELPHELSGIVAHITINFPWGSLLKSLLGGDTRAMNGLSSIAKQNAQIEILLNSGALIEADSDLNDGTRRIQENLSRYGWSLKHPKPLDNWALRNIPTTWAKRLAYGRDPRAIALSGKRTA